jgi:hypothetical protein
MPLARRTVRILSPLGGPLYVFTRAVVRGSPPTGWRSLSCSSGNRYSMLRSTALVARSDGPAGYMSVVAFASAARLYWAGVLPLNPAYPQSSYGNRWCFRFWVGRNNETLAMAHRRSRSRRHSVQCTDDLYVERQGQMAVPAILSRTCTLWRRGRSPI